MGKKCTATKKNGEPCSAWAISGGEVCYHHGGAASQVQEKAQQRLDRLAAPAIAELGRIIEDNDASDSDKIKACKDVLDRAGYPKTERKEFTGKDGEPMEHEHSVNSDTVEKYAEMFEGEDESEQ
jgi:hypothetical protein